MEKLFELHTEGDFDILVLDTPPSRNALDFLEAPRRLTQFIEGKIAEGLHEADRVRGEGGQARGRPVALSVMKRIVGFDLIADLAGVLQRLQRHGRRLQGARQTGQQAARLRRPPASSSSAARRASRSRRPSTSTANWSRAKLPFGGVIVNKVHYPAEELRGDDEDLPATLGGEATATRTWPSG